MSQEARQDILKRHARALHGCCIGCCCDTTKGVTMRRGPPEPDRSIGLSVQSPFKRAETAFRRALARFV
jgi:hypothetical protein